ncbi:hypothetical protein [Porphyromonas pogonae]|nr:hypothetical protein [Porphyromonas pogonae]
MTKRESRKQQSNLPAMQQSQYMFTCYDVLVGGVSLISNLLIMMTGG